MPARPPGQVGQKRAAGICLFPEPAPKGLDSSRQSQTGEHILLDREGGTPVSPHSRELQPVSDQPIHPPQLHLVVVLGYRAPNPVKAHPELLPPAPPHTHMCTPKPSPPPKSMKGLREPAGLLEAGPGLAWLTPTLSVPALSDPHPLPPGPPRRQLPLSGPRRGEEGCLGSRTFALRLG